MPKSWNLTNNPSRASGSPGLNGKSDCRSNFQSETKNPSGNFGRPERPAVPAEWSGRWVRAARRTLGWWCRPRADEGCTGRWRCRRSCRRCRCRRRCRSCCECGRWCFRTRRRPCWCWWRTPPRQEWWSSLHLVMMMMMMMMMVMTMMTMEMKMIMMVVAKCRRCSFKGMFCQDAKNLNQTMLLE